MTTTRENIHCYAIRRLSPFKGLWHILKTPYGTAVTPNGDFWQIQVLVEMNHSGWGSLNQHAKRKRYCLFGTWSKSQGLQRSPLNPTVDLQSTAPKASMIVEHLQNFCSTIPFPLHDNFELWLLDKHSMQPVALLASTNDEDKISPRNGYEWQAFDSKEENLEHLKRLLDDANIAMSLAQARGELHHIIMQRCGSTPAAQWFRRNNDASATGLVQIHADPMLQGRLLDANAFPSLLLCQEWVDDRDSKLVECYLQWISPALLNLQTLSVNNRATLEQTAFQQPLELLKHAAAYPCVIDQDGLNTALVQAKIRIANQIL